MDLLKWFRPKTESDPEENDPPWKPDPDFPRAVDDAMRLLVYSAETGRSVDDTTRTSILRAKAATSAGWDDTQAASLLAALTKLADELKPVTAESLEASADRLTKPTIKTLRLWACLLAIPIFLFSVLGFVTSSISSAIRTDIATANELVVKLRGSWGHRRRRRKELPRSRSFPRDLTREMSSRNCSNMPRRFELSTPDLVN